MHSCWLTIDGTIGLVLISWKLQQAFTYRKLNKSLPDRDPFIFPLAMFLLCWGSWKLAAVSGIWFRQTVWMAVCLACLYGLSGKPVYLDRLRRYKYIGLDAVWH